MNDVEDEQPESAIGSASDETQVVAKDAETQLGRMAWSEDDSAEPVRHSWESAWGRAAVLVSVGTAVATATANSKETRSRFIGVAFLTLFSQFRLAGGTIPFIRKYSTSCP